MLSVYTFFAVSGSLFGAGEKTFVLGAAAGWDLMEKRNGVTELAALRPHPVLALSSAGNAGGDLFAESLAPEPSLDLALSFDEGRPELFRDLAGHYRVAAGGSLSAADYRWARSGAGAALFTGDEGPGTEGAGPLILFPGPEARLAPGRPLRDFTMEFWLCPQNMETGEQILRWTSSKALAGGDFVFQRILCVSVKNRLQWTFQDFFSSPGGERRISVSLNGTSPLVPRVWSHHLVRFDADTGLLEYLVNGAAEAITHTTLSGREGGEVYTPVMGEDGSLILGSRYRGLLDEFRIHGQYVVRRDLGKYPPAGGRVESRPIDLGEGVTVLQVDASGGRAAVSGRERRNEYAGTGDFRFRDNEALQFFIRAADSPYLWTDADWRPFVPGVALAPDVRGRFVQVAADFYPSGSGESTPYLEELRIQYQSGGPPLPPSRLTAIARDGAVELSWKASPERRTEGYLVYYGTAPGEYFGSQALLGDSPIDAGNQVSLRIEGLRNGTLYYFAVAAYDRQTPPRPGEFSRETAARPLRVYE